MQKTVYICDQCDTVIGNKPHVSLVLATSSTACGVAIPPKAGKGGWHVKNFGKNFLHFCGSKCIGAFFGNALKEAQKV